jgi:hypothetical protein
MHTTAKYTAIHGIFISKYGNCHECRDKIPALCILQIIQYI